MLTSVFAAYGILVAFACPSEARPADAGSSQLEFTTDRAVVFKNGYALIVKSARGTADTAGCVYTDRVPDRAILGAFWATAKDRPIRGMRAQWVNADRIDTEPVSAISMSDILRANVGQRLTLGLSPSPGPELVGTVVRLLEIPLDAPKGGPETPPQVKELGTKGGQFAVIETSDAQQHVLPVSYIRTVSGRTLKTQVDRRIARRERRKRLSFDLGQQAAGRPVELVVFYFTEGLRWIPTYRLTGDLQKKGQLYLQSELINELEPLENTEVDLVVGVPTFRFDAVPSPLTLESTLRRSLAQAAPALMGQQTALSNALFTQRRGELRSRRPSPPPIDVPAISEKDSDLFVYRAGRMTLGKGARAAISLWNHDVDFEHIHTVRLSTAQLMGPAPTKQGTTLHQLRLANRSRTPWTTGPVLVLDGWLPRAQSLLTFTAPGARSLLPLTAAVDIRVELEEEEIGRQTKALDWNGRAYAKITKRSRITVNSDKPHPVRLEIDLVTGGRVTEASDQGRITHGDFDPRDWPSGSDTVNTHSEVRFRLSLKPRAQKTLHVTRTYFIR